MADREKVIYSIERCICHVPDACRDCGYDNEPCPKCFEHLLRDAHDLLKAQEPGWISVKDSLPDEQGTYLAFRKEPYEIVRYFYNMPDAIAWADRHMGHYKRFDAEEIKEEETDKDSVED